MSNTIFIFPVLFVLIAIVGFILLSIKKKKKEGFINGRPDISTQDNCSKCSTKYTKYAHNKPLNSDGQIMM